LSRYSRDPQEEKQTTLKSSPFKDVYEEWLDHPGRKQVLRERTREGYERIFKLHVEPHIGKTPISALTDEAVRNAVEKVRKATTNAKKGQRGLQGTHALKLIHAVCEYATDKNYIGRNPARGVDPPVPMQNPEGRQHRPPSDEELQAIWNDAPEHMNAQNVRILRLALLLGKRVSEMVEAKKSELQLEGDNPHWFIPGERTGNKAREDQIVPLPKLAVALLREACAADEGSHYVFPARSLEDKPTTRHAPSQAFTEFRRAVAIDEEVRFHDARGLIIDQMSKLKVPREYRSHVLHHTGDMRATLADAVYSTYDFAEEKRRALRLWALRLQEIVRGRHARGLHW
jgi:integrase